MNKILTAGFVTTCISLILSMPAFSADAEINGKAKWQEMKAQFDTDGDGTLNDAERALFRAEKQRKRFAEIDTNGDGQISFAEQSVASEKRRSKMIARFDQDGNGELNEAERQIAKAARKQMRQCRKAANSNI